MTRIYLGIAAAVAIVLLVLGLLAWDAKRLKDQYDAGYNKAQQECDESKRTAEKEVEKDASEKEALALAAAEARQQKLDETLSRIQQASSAALTLYRRSVNELSTVANGCRVPASRMRAINEALGHPPSAPAADVREVRED